MLWSEMLDTQGHAPHDLTQTKGLELANSQSQKIEQRLAGAGGRRRGTGIQFLRGAESPFGMKSKCGCRQEACSITGGINPAELDNWKWFNIALCTYNEKLLGKQL